MGAIVSHRKGQRRISRVEQKAIAVSAFSTQSAKADENTRQEQESAYKLINSCLNSLELFIECRNYTKKST